MKSKFIYCENEWGGTKAFHREGLFFSKKFCEYFSKNFTTLFFKETGLRPSTKVTLAGYKQYNETPIYEPGPVSKLNLVLWIMPEYNDDISFCWKSKTGAIIQTTDEEFDEEDLVCWMEGLKPSEYWSQVATEKKAHPFQVAGLPYELKVFDYGTDMELRIFTDGSLPNEVIKNTITTTIETFNSNTEKHQRKDGVVHNYQYEESDGFLCARIDTGSAGIPIINKVLKSLVKHTDIGKIEIDI